LVLFLSTFCFNQEVTLSYENYNPEDGTVEIWIDTEYALYGAQFQVTGFHVTEAEMGEGIQGFVFLATSYSGIILTNGMEFEIISGYHHFCTVNFDAIYSDTSCVIDPIFINEYYEQVSEIDTGDCLETGYCGFIGDLNSDDELDVLDVVIAVNCILEEILCSCADLNADYLIDVTDIVEMVSIIMGV